MGSVIWQDFINSQKSSAGNTGNGGGLFSQKPAEDTQSSPIKRTIVNPTPKTQSPNPMMSQAQMVQQPMQQRMAYGNQPFEQAYPQQPVFPYPQQGYPQGQYAQMPFQQQPQVQFPAQSQEPFMMANPNMFAMGNDETKRLQMRISELEDKVKKAQFESRHDVSLTMLRNKLAFDEDMNKMMKKAGNSLYRVVAFNVDLRYVNAKEGRDKGDQQAGLQSSSNMFTVSAVRNSMRLQQVNGTKRNWQECVRRLSARARILLRWRYIVA